MWGNMRFKRLFPFLFKKKSNKYIPGMTIECDMGGMMSMVKSEIKEILDNPTAKFFKPGTNHSKDVYTDKEFTTIHTHPILLSRSDQNEIFHDMEESVDFIFHDELYKKQQHFMNVKFKEVVTFLQKEGYMKKQKDHKEISRKSIRSVELLKKYLLSHESDIAHEINDFGDLYDAFRLVVGRKPDALL